MENEEGEGEETTKMLAELKQPEEDNEVVDNRMDRGCYHCCFCH